jgi:hypothetical protein
MAIGMAQVLMVGNQVIVRSNWQWNSGAPGGGTYLQTPGKIAEVGDDGIVLQVDGGPLRAFPYAGITHVDLVKKG